MIVCLHFITVLAALACLLMIPSYYYSATKESVAEKKLEDFNSKNPQINISELNSEISATNERLDFLVKKKPKFNVSESVVDELLGARVPGVSITQIMYNNSKDDTAHIQILGVARDRASLHDFNDSIVNKNKFSSVDLPISNFVKPSNIDYNLSLYLK